MAIPIVSWTRDATAGLEPLTNWNIGTVDAGSTSTEFSCLIWNNKGGAVDVSDMLNCTITTKDSQGGNTGDLVKDTWIQARCDSISETEFVAIGGETTHPIKTSGVTNMTDGTTATPGQAPHDGESGSEVCCLGVANDGTVENAAGNFIGVTLRAVIPSDAAAGTVQFLTRCSYQYT